MSLIQLSTWLNNIFPSNFLGIYSHLRMSEPKALRFSIRITVLACDLTVLEKGDYNPTISSYKELGWHHFLEVYKLSCKNFKLIGASFNINDIKTVGDKTAFNWFNYKNWVNILWKSYVGAFLHKLSIAVGLRRLPYPWHSRG